MERFEKDLRIILSKIEMEIDSMQKELNHLNETVDEDVKKILADYSEELGELDINFDDMRTQYYERLYSIKKESLDNF